MEHDQDLMLKRLRTNDYGGVVEIINEAEEAHAPDYQNSRIAEQEGWDDIAVFLLAQRPRAVLESILEGTLPERALPNGDLADEIRRPGDPAELEGSYDPVVYLNWLAGEDGRGLSIPEFEHFLDVFEEAAELDGEENPAMRQRINQQYKRIVNYRSQNGFYDTFENASLKNYRTSVKEIVKHYRTRILPLACLLGLLHVMFKPEAGWSIRGYKRAPEHARLRPSSPHAMRLARLVLDLEFPQRRFSLHQFYLFDIVREEHGAIGESIASQICASYNAAYGGFNTWQAGISDNSTRNILVSEWQKIMKSAEENGYLENVVPNLENFANFTQQSLDAAQEEADRQNMLEDLQQRTEENEALTHEIEELTDQLAEREVNLANLTQEARTALDSLHESGTVRREHVDTLCRELARDDTSEATECLRSMVAALTAEEES